MAERLAYTEVVAGSIPVRRTVNTFTNLRPNTLAISWATVVGSFLFDVPHTQWLRGAKSELLGIRLIVRKR